MINSSKYALKFAYKNGFKCLNLSQNLSRTNILEKKKYLRINSNFINLFSTSAEKINFNYSENESKKYSKFLFGLVGLLGYGFYKLNCSVTHCEENPATENDPEKDAGRFIEGLPIYTEEQVLEHGKDAKTIWVSFKNGVYDITDFIEGHPGGNKILLSAGTSIEPFWEIYAVHKKPEVYEMLEEYRIGNLKHDTSKKTPNSNTQDAYANEPKRHPLLKILTLKPFNAETPKEFSADNLITPNDLHFVRNHMPVPQVDMENFKLEILDELNGKTFEFKMDDLEKKFPTYTIPVTLQCSGNKRKFMNEYQPVQGLMWDVNAISTAEWTGVKLKDLLVHCGIDLNDQSLKHVQFEGLDKDLSGGAYAASIPIDKVLNDNGDVIIAFKMNGEDIPLDHGFPLRAVVPGIIGARSVKWLGKIVLSERESQSHWQLNDYKVLSPSVKNLKDADFSKLKAVQESPIQSAICEPVEGGLVSKDNGTFKVKGYAFSGGGNDVESVLISTDGGSTWKNANLKKFDRPLYRSWAWSLWEAELDIPADKNNIEIVCVATDSTQNTQPETYKSIWNARGLMNNSWHRVRVNFE